MANVTLYKELEALGSVNYPYRIQDLSITRSISDDMWSLTGFVDKTTVPNPLDHILVKQRDHTGTWKNIFHGVMPQYDQNLETSNNNIRIQAYSMEWYLAHQFLDWQNFQTMTYTQNAGTSTEITHYENPSNFIKRLFYGATYAGTANPPWTRWTVGSTQLAGMALATGHPQDVARWLLPADTGFLNSDIIQKQFIFDTRTSKLDAIREIADYGKMVYFARPSHTTDFLTTFYMANSADLDTQMSVPAKQPISAASNLTLDPITKRVDHNLKFNKVTLAMVDKVNGKWYYATQPTTPPNPSLEYRIQSSDLNNGSVTALATATAQAIVNAKCLAIYNYFTSGTTTYSFELKSRFDLEPYQLINFTGFSSPVSLPTTDFRITRVVRNIGNEFNTVTVECTDNTQWSKHRELARLFGNDFQRQMQATKDKYFINLTKIAVGTVQTIDVNTGTAIVKLEKGDYAEWGENLVRARLLNQY